MCQRLNTGESNNFYVGIFICCGPLRAISESTGSFLYGKSGKRVRIKFILETVSD